MYDHELTFHVATFLKAETKMTNKTRWTKNGIFQFSNVLRPLHINICIYMYI